MTQQEPDERIAKVTYLFGIAPDVATAAPPVVEPVETAKRVEPVETAKRVEPVETAKRVELVETLTQEVSAGSTTENRPTTTRRENVSMHALTRRGMSIAEMTRLLEAREIEPEDVEAEIERLEGVGLLDDQALADNLVRTLQERKGLGRSAISAELRRRKVDQGAIDEALDSIDTDDELARAIEVATKRAGQLSSYDAATAKRRLGAYLQRRGYSGSVLSAAMNAALSPRDTGGVRFR